MSDSFKPFYYLTALFATFAFVAFVASPAAAWYPAAHNNLGEDLGESGNVSSQYMDELSEEPEWPDSDEAEDGNGTYGISEEKNPWQDKYLPPFCCMTANWDHFYEVNLNQGSAPDNTQRFIGWAAQWYINNGYENYGFKMLGRGLHYPQDMSMPYHTAAAENLTAWEHFQYESWHKNNYEKHDFGYWQGLGAKYSYETVSSDGDLADKTKELANKSYDQLSDVYGGNWGDDVFATQYNMYLLGKYAGPMAEYAAPGYFNF